MNQYADPYTRISELEARLAQAEAREAAWMELGRAMLAAGLLRGEWAVKVREVLVGVEQP